MKNVIVYALALVSFLMPLAHIAAKPQLKHMWVHTIVDKLRKDKAEEMVVKKKVVWYSKLYHLLYLVGLLVLHSHFLYHLIQAYTSYYP